VKEELEGEAAPAKPMREDTTTTEPMCDVSAGATPTREASAIVMAVHEVSSAAATPTRGLRCRHAGKGREGGCAAKGEEVRV
jgi:hypothetical protein